MLPTFIIISHHGMEAIYRRICAEQGAGQIDAGQLLELLLRRLPANELTRQRETN